MAASERSGGLPAFAARPAGMLTVEGVDCTGRGPSMAVGPADAGAATAQQLATLPRALAADWVLMEVGAVTFRSIELLGTWCGVPVSPITGGGRAALLPNALPSAGKDGVGMLISRRCSA